MNIKTIAALAVAVSMGLTSGAFAHPHLRMGNPPVNGTVSGAVKELRLTFSETVSPKVSGIKITDSKGKPIATGTARRDVKNSKQLVVPLQAALKAGKYQLNWFAVGKDMHPVKGRYAFTVKS
jgi:methionine-rich copper-binding protein CopC